MTKLLPDRLDETLLEMAQDGLLNMETAGKFIMRIQPPRWSTS
jgi:hypothetical protein